MTSKKNRDFSFCNYLRSEFNRGYQLENDEERYTARREKVYAFFRIPLEIEKFFIFGFLQCADSFFCVVTFLPIRFSLVLWSLFLRSSKVLLGSHTGGPILKPAEIVDLIKVFLLVVSLYIVSFIDTSVYYHLIKTQSTIKLYLFFNMLEIADKLMSSFGQDTLDALFWTATEPNDRKGKESGKLSTKFFHLVLTPSYVVLHSIIVLMQALTLNVAINSDNKGLLTILISNNFVELKGAVFKKFDRNNLLQIACSDVRERFHYCILLFVVVIQTMKEYSWKEDRLYILLPDCFIIFVTEIMIDWLKHAFITRFNDISITAYRDYNILIASDLIVCKQKNAYTDHSDLVARRMGFIPLPLTVVIVRVLSQALTFANATSFALFALGFLCLLTTRILVGIVILGKACDLVECVEFPRSRNVSECVENSTPQIIRRRHVSKDLKDKKEEAASKRTEKDKLHPNDLTSLKMTPSSSSSKKGFLFSSDGEPMTGGGASSTLAAMEERLSTPLKEEPITFFQDSSPDKTSSGHSRSLSNTDDLVPSLSFLGDSRSGLMANSMVDISSIGFSQAIVDADASDECDAKLFSGNIDKIPFLTQGGGGSIDALPTEEERPGDLVPSAESEESNQDAENPFLRTSVSSPLLNHVEDLSHSNSQFDSQDKSPS